MEPASPPDSPPPSAPPSPPAASPGPSRRLGLWLTALLPVLLVVSVIGAYVTWWDPDALQSLKALGGANDNHAAGRVTPAPEPTPTRLRPGHDYYIFVRTVELYPQKTDGGKWDAIGGAAPDIRYSLSWQDQVVYTSDVRPDTLIAVWDPINIDVASALPLLGEGKIELASTLNQGAIVNVDPDQETGGTLSINLWDQDSIGLGSDAAGQIDLELADLLEGENTFSFEQTTDNAVKRIVLGTTDTAEPVKNLIQALSQPR